MKYCIHQQEEVPLPRPQAYRPADNETKPIEVLLEAYEAGQRDFGESYVEELVEKAEKMPKDIRWHFIGHLQSNKVNKLMTAPIYAVQTVDSLK